MKALGVMASLLYCCQDPASGSLDLRPDVEYNGVMLMPMTNPWDVAGDEWEAGLGRLGWQGTSG